MDNKQIEMPKKKGLSSVQSNEEFCFNDGFNVAIDLSNAHLVKKLEGIEEILKKFITHILWYHDKEGGRTEDVEIIFKSRFKDLATAIKTMIMGE